MLADLRTLGTWVPRRWLVAAGVGVAYLLAVAVPTDLFDTPVFTRDVPPTWWAWPSLLASALLVGLLAASYVADHPSGATDPAGPAGSPRPSRFGVVGSLLTFFAVGCPVCNKVVLLVLGYTGALTWFQPLQPLLQAGAIGLLAWALLARLRGARRCAVDVEDPAPSPPRRTKPTTPSTISQENQ
ncbi:hypothetical protein [Segeticoccus rhizosphaerae]|uniref:hypothetical protein n=1 Tax=Segeticoccus rhizosphaerae TaxID=1104777 RepID=UPI00192E2F3B|nr:hypothetical protein [Ornithinicoccus soli]